MLIPLLQSIYDPVRPLPPFDHADEMLADVELFHLHAQLYALLQASGRMNQLPPDFQIRLKTGYHRTLGQSLFCKHKENELLNLFEAQRTEAIVLKGARFAERYFGSYTARLTSDIDMFVPKNRLSDTIAMLERHGYQFEIAKDHHARLLKNGVLVELHWTLDIPEWSDLHASSFWQSAESIAPYQYIKELSPLHTLYFICLHGARHQMNSLRYLLDIAQILHAHADRVNLPDLMELAKENRTIRRIQAVLSIVYSQFPHLHRLKPLPFPAIDTPWKYEIVRGAWLGEKSGPYYRYKLYFRHFMHDTWKHRIHSIRKPY